MLLDILQGTGQRPTAKNHPAQKKSAVQDWRRPVIDEIIGMLSVPEHNTHVGFAGGLSLASPKLLIRRVHWVCL